MVGELLIFRRQRGIELDGHAMGRWNGDDDEPGLGLTLIGRDRHTRSVPVDATHRGVEQDACAELGGGRLGDLLSIVARAAAEARGQQVDEAADAAMRAAVEGQIEAESLPLVLSGMLYDDGVIDPRDTRTVLGMCLSAIANGPIKGTSNFGVFRM